MKFIFHLLLILFSFNLNAQLIKPKTKKRVTLFASWGYNRAWFTNSSIHFIGNDYNFTLKHTKAQDRQSTFNFKTYFNPASLTIPQYDFCIGVSLPNHVNIIVGQDHMKYVVQQYSTSTITGNIHNQSEYDGDFQNVEKKITPNFLQFEHTDGLNYVHLRIDKEKVWIKNQFKYLQLTSDIGLNAGVIIPRSDITLMNYERNDNFHLAGYGIGFNAGVKAAFFKAFFFRLDHKIGFINMPYILTRGIEYSDRAKQHFGFSEFYFSVGVQRMF